MADRKISALTALTGANVDDATDTLPIVDDSAGQTKKITRTELFKDVEAITAGTLSLDGAVTWGAKAVIADDAVATFTPPFKGGWMFLAVNSNAFFPQERSSVLGHIDVGSSVAFGQVYKGVDATVLTNDQDLSATAGVDGNTTVSLRSNGTLQINNRSGFSRTFDIHLKGST